MEGEKIKILVVDDDPFLLDMYSLKFSQNNFEVHVADNGLKGIEKLQTGEKFKIIITDVIMPEMDGFEMLAKINADNLAPDSIKIILSNKSQQTDRDQGDALGVSGYIVKANSTPGEVVEQVNAILLQKKEKMELPPIEPLNSIPK